MLTNKNYTINDDILIFNPEIDTEHIDYNVSGLDVLCEMEKKHFWNQARLKFVQNYFNKFIKKDSKILEVGCGIGHIASNLEKQGYKNIHVSDIHVKGLKYAKSTNNLNKLYQFDLHKPPFEDEFDVICFFDVLEHLANDDLILRNIHKMLKPGGKIILAVLASGSLDRNKSNIASEIWSQILSG
jgi:2-polyprenyl-3-methyl-5-hydroxy-6-metoxy-1,4-benzoquinol methylase